jgi:hypothetical protein
MKYFLSLLSLCVPLPGQAQTVQQQAAAAVTPAAPVPPVRYTPLEPEGVNRPLTERGDWKAVNADVGEYRRGHIDILKAEQSRAPDATQPRETGR